MHILLIKTSSLGDVIHTLPALSDMLQVYPDVQVDWVIEEAFAEIPAWHPAVMQVIPVAIRRWRKSGWQAWSEWKAFVQTLQSREYDLVIDAQGLLKSAWLTWHARGRRCGLDWQSAREPLASWLYNQRIVVPRGQHAVLRLRRLFAAALDYQVPAEQWWTPDYGIAKTLATAPSHKPTLVFLHGTTWATKHYPEPYWRHLAHLAGSVGYEVRLPWGSQVEQQRAERLARGLDHVTLIPKSNLRGLATELAQARAVIGVDTGLSHLAAALNVPSISLYGATQAGLTGTLGQHQAHMSARFNCSPCLRKRCRFKPDTTHNAFPPCYATLPPIRVWNTLQTTLHGC